MTNTITQQLNIKKFPFRIKDDNGKLTYQENSNGFWYRYEYDDRCNTTYYEDSDGAWYRYEYDDEGNKTYSEYSNGFKTGTKKSDIKELTLEDIAKLVGIPVENLKIIK